MKKKYHNQGFTLLFAALIGSLVLTVGMAILSITIKQLTLSSAGKATQQSFYSADAGVECALYLDRGAGNPNCRLGFFPTPTTTLSYTHAGAWSCVDENPDYLLSARCMGRDFGEQINSNVCVSGINPSCAGGDYGDVTTTIELRDDPSTPNSGDAATNDDMCFVVVVTKRASDGSTIIESRGYNTCNERAVNRYERAIRSVNQ